MKKIITNPGDAIVLGLGFGDEGKGLVTNYLASLSDYSQVVRFSGGHQSGHTVYDKELKHGKHVFSSYGSGTLYGLPTYVTENCLIDPAGLIKEQLTLILQKVSPVIYIDKRCPITTPFEVEMNRSDHVDLKNGSCGKGIWYTRKRELEGYSLMAGDLKFPSILHAKLESISKNYYKFGVDLDTFLGCIDVMLENKNIVLVEGYEPPTFSPIIYEGSQGLLLDENHGIYPNITPSSLGLSNFEEIDYDTRDVFLVSRAYQTRHGAGFASTELLGNNIKDNPYETNIGNKYQGELRIGILDLDLYEYSLWRHSIEFRNSNFVLTHLDLVIDAWQFFHKGKVHSFLSEEEFIQGITKILGTPKHLYLSRSPYSEDLEKMY